MEFELRPEQGVPPVLLGATLAEARSALQGLGFLDVEDFQRAPDEPGALLFNGPAGRVSGFVYADEDGRVVAIEIANPNPRNAPGEGQDTVVYSGLDVFGTPAQDVIEALTAATEVDVDGDSVIAPDLFMEFSRGGEHHDRVDGDGRATFFSSVLLAGEDYY
ncbi:hypothetical protein E1287_17715 [Actinomadura sp. KC06]|uniref:hypothetical protein n=1 Tax=Actinomadura sp. KC06 TaxID=2530369 RepID=UPI001047D3EB|nr:hypothetical protein [Actinomadura sp. KC06]TDD34051.1 hypothetical protein E1287_17715 [Actinomadura sp. KC06]